jgi:hypothetical protein
MSSILDDGNETDLDSIDHELRNSSETFTWTNSTNPLLPVKRSGERRGFVRDRWGNSNANVMFECGSILFDAYLDEPVDCRVFVDKHLVTFQSVRDGESENYKQFTDVKIYVMKMGRFASDFFAVGAIVKSTQFSLIINGVIIDFVERKGDNVELRQRLVDPKKLPRDLNLKVVPLSPSAGNYLQAIRSAIKDHLNLRPPLIYSNCYMLANKIIGTLSLYTLTLCVETSSVLSEGFYKTIKVKRIPGDLWKKYKWQESYKIIVERWL